jgi:hypothetical protein
MTLNPKHIAYRDEDDCPEVLLDSKMLSFVALITPGHPDKQNGTDDIFYPLDPKTYDRLFPNSKDCWV